MYGNGFGEYNCVRVWLNHIEAVHVYVCNSKYIVTLQPRILYT